MEFKIDNIEVYGINESVKSSGYPKSVDTTSDIEVLSLKDMERASKLGHAKIGSGHDCWLKGIVVQWDVTASHAFWIQYLRYHFSDIISSQSKMHKITEMNLDAQCNRYVLIDILNICIKLKDYYLTHPTKENFFDLIYNLPMGLMLTARCTDNYLSLKTQYYQRKTDKLYEWHEYCEAVEALPMFKEYIL